jgi:hypothetical protein
LHGQQQQQQQHSVEHSPHHFMVKGLNQAAIGTRMKKKLYLHSQQQ